MFSKKNVVLFWPFMPPFLFFLFGIFFGWVNYSTFLYWGVYLWYFFSKKKIEKWIVPKKMWNWNFHRPQSFSFIYLFFFFFLILRCWWSNNLWFYSGIHVQSDYLFVVFILLHVRLWAHCLALYIITFAACTLLYFVRSWIYLLDRLLYLFF